ncbi:MULTISPECIES: chromosome partitioning protein ParB [Acidithiobacillus]|jgi:hypothetical protein|uniref:chromosome partitioning protein ParB n=1 Tax=Acidithiobacillus TaxID=119977 RepID=UPI001C06585E|nr:MULTISPECIES: chromosome partitioning protein ParB [Acidithiobacillus]MBU2718168.1 chromosome partitioning protein ParB [Acidithiobacillus ferridurans]MBU2732491.1 chromosome partitioning protein ParB [Acidithiobacillus ferridurans]MBU2851640.1 chromosome partitioning protein ParB [Acidithiobacillus ferrivorans]MDD2657791.1 chromosome partitioning protein ParB [Candidatus Paceibacterota bacterium]
MSKQGTLTAGRPSATKSRAATLASLADDTAMKRVNFELPADQHTKLKIYATRQGKTIKELLTEYVAQLPER